MKRILAVLALLALTTLAALANNSQNGAYFYNVPSSVLTRTANTTTYTANTAVCAAASVTVCAPITLSAGEQPSGLFNGEHQTVRLLKSGATTTNATFNVWFYSDKPRIGAALFDDVAYVGPYAADLPNYIGEAQCTTANATNDGTAKTWYDCTLANPNTSGAFVFQTAGGTNTIYAMIEVTAAYAPASAETFQLFISGFY
jgi:hypothetical protein